MPVTITKVEESPILDSVGTRIGTLFTAYITAELPHAEYPKRKVRIQHVVYTATRTKKGICLLECKETRHMGRMGLLSMNFRKDARALGAIKACFKEYLLTLPQVEPG